jgi:tetratricopeptide (TPR) repeat protein
MKFGSPGLRVLLGLSTAAAIGLGVAIDKLLLPPPVNPAWNRAAIATALTGDRLTPSEQLALMLAIARDALQRKNPADAIAWAQRFVASGGAESDARPLLARAYFELGDFANAARELQWEIQLGKHAGRPPGEADLLMLRQCYTKLGDANAYAWALGELLTYHPRREYWADLLDRTEKRPDFGPLQALDLERLRLMTGTLGGESDYLALAEQAREAGFPAEAERVIDRGIANGVLGRGSEAARHRQWERQLVDENLAQQQRINRREVEIAAESASDGIELFDLGFAHVTLGNYDKGLALMEKGLRKGRLAGRPQYARLHLGIAFLMAGRKASAIETFELVGGRHTAPDLARLWIIYARNAT